MKKLHIQRAILLGLFLLTVLWALGALYFYSRSLRATAIAAVFAAVLAGLFLLLLWIDNRSIAHTIVQLSELLDNIMQLDGREVFPAEEDTLLSRLQCQVLQLTGILKARAEEASREKEDVKSLISNLSHQLKTPVASLRLYAELLEGDDLSAEARREYLAIMRSSLEKLVFLTDTMVKMTRLEGGVITLQPRLGDIGETILTAIAPVFRIARAKGIELQYTEPTQKMLLPHDPRWTAEALQNILDNAVKYTAAGCVRVTTQCYELYYRVDIADTGPGIPEAEQPLVFRRFYRGSIAANAEGAGIGLYLARTIITGQGGYIKLTSNGEGSTFSVFLPLPKKGAGYENSNH